jgi:hypothetical protein
VVFYVNRNTDTAYKTIKGTRRSKSRTNILVPEAKNALDSFKAKVASDLGINFSVEDKGNFTAKDCGKVGGEMVRRIIMQMKQEMASGARDHRYQ